MAGLRTRWGGWVVLAFGLGGLAVAGPPEGAVTGPTLPIELAAIEHQVVGGRLIIDRPRRFRDREYQKTHPDGTTETYSLAGAATNPRERYVRVVPGIERLTVEIADRERVTIVREPLEGSTRPGLTFTQVPQQPLRLAYQSPIGSFEFVAADLWRLYVAQPQALEDNLFPILERLDGEWQLADQARQMLACLVETEAASTPAASHPPAPAGPTPESLLARLDSASAPERRAAALTLERMALAGTVDVPALLTRPALTAEQRSVLTKLQVEVRRSPSDRPADVAARLAPDATVWLTLLTHPEADVRGRIASRLEAIAGGGHDLSRWASRPATPRELSELGRILRITR